ncbi:MAG: hypothetical protein KAJ10_09400, partial [Thermodesulfovibrionia bacterium]|nr:hypothetical protein [Thermodesulfovibrionia bacterium]
EDGRPPDDNDSYGVITFPCGIRINRREKSLNSTDGHYLFTPLESPAASAISLRFITGALWRFHFPSLYNC